MRVISQNFFYSIQNKYFLSKKKKEELDVLQERYWALVELYRLQKKRSNCGDLCELGSSGLIKSADALRGAYSLLAKNDCGDVSTLLDKAKIELEQCRVLAGNGPAVEMLENEDGTSRLVGQDDDECSAEKMIVAEEDEAQSEELVLKSKLDADISDKEPSPKAAQLPDGESFQAVVCLNGALIEVCRNLLEESGESPEKLDVLKCWEAKLDSYKKVQSEESFSDLQSLMEKGIECFAEGAAQKHRNHRNEQALLKLRTMGGKINKQGSSSVLRQLTLGEMRRLFSLTKKQNMSSVRLGVVGSNHEMERLFSQLGGRDIAFLGERKSEPNGLLWRISLSAEFVLYIVGIPHLGWKSSRERDLLLAELNSVTILATNQGELTAEEDLARRIAQIACGSVRVCGAGNVEIVDLDGANKDGDKPNDGKTDKETWALISPLLIERV